MQFKIAKIHTVCRLVALLVSCVIEPLGENVSKQVIEMKLRETFRFEGKQNNNY